MTEATVGGAHVGLGIVEIRLKLASKTCDKAGNLETSVQDMFGGWDRSVGKRETCDQKVTGQVRFLSGTAGKFSVPWSASSADP